MGLVDPAVVQLESPSVDVGLERFVGVREVGKHVPGHQALLCLGEFDNGAISYCKWRRHR